MYTHQIITRPFSKRRKRPFWPWFFLSVILFLGIFFWQKDLKKEKVVSESVEESVSVEKVAAEPETEQPVCHRVTDGDIPAEVFSEVGKLDANDVEALLEASQEVYDFTKIKIGRELRFYFAGEEKAKKIEYDWDIEQKVVAERTEEGFLVEKVKIPYETKEETARVEIDEFLYKDALDAGLSEASILEIADIFSFDVDFATDIRSGDLLSVVYEKRTLNGQPAPDGRILAAKFVNVGQEYFGYYFEEDGEGSHYDGEGRELLRQFLRAPLSYRQITSGYTGARMHPITKTVTAHYQIDYAAPAGTPVVATARGTVSSAGWSGGWGNIVRLTHDNGYTTHYGHLSAFGKGIKAGGSVGQGQVIGYVGSTGWSTGPHLDYGMKLNGSPVNPLTLKLPKGNLLGEEKLEKFRQVKEKYFPLL